MICPKCNNNLPDTAAFCTACGTPLAAPAQAAPAQAVPVQPVPVQPAMAPNMAAPQQAMAPSMTAPQQAMAPSMAAPQQAMAPNMGAPIQIVPAGKSIRIRCAACKNVADVQNDAGCPKCGAPSAPGGYIKMYRMGSPLGVAVGFGIYIDNEPTGYIGNKQTCWIRVPFGTHRLHVAQGANRRCNDAMITITPDHPLEAVKVAIKAGFWSNSFNIQATNPSEIPD